MSRQTQNQQPDASCVFTDHSICGCTGGLITTFTNEHEHKQAQESDFLGLLKYARDLNNTSVQAEIAYTIFRLTRRHK